MKVRIDIERRTTQIHTVDVEMVDAYEAMKYADYVRDNEGQALATFMPDVTGSAVHEYSILNVEVSYDDVFQEWQDNPVF